MKKTRFILLALVAAMVLMGAGYAAWSQTFTIGSTVTTGELYVVVGEESMSVRVDTNGDGSYDDEDGFVEVTPENAKDNYLPEGYPSATAANSKVDNASALTYTIPKIYPGVQITSQVKFTNAGTIKTQTSVNTENCTVTNSTLFDALKITVGEVEIIGESTNDKLSALADAIATAVGELEPGDDNSKNITIIQELPIGEPGDNTTENLGGETWKVGFIFEQYNASESAPSTGGGEGEGQ
jgi:hypothetical protein